METFYIGILDNGTLTLTMNAIIEFHKITSWRKKQEWDVANCTEFVLDRYR